MSKPVCGSCKWMNQGEGSCHCFNPNQEDNSLKRYCYWSFDCPLHEQGPPPTKEEMKALGWDYVKGENGWMCYVPEIPYAEVVK